MSDFVVTGPTGQRFQVSAPDGASQSDIIAYAQQQTQQASAAAPAPQAAPQPPTATMTAITPGAPSGQIPITSIPASPVVPGAQAGPNPLRHANEPGVANTGDDTEFGKGIHAGVLDTESMVGGLIGLTGESTGNEAMKNWGLSAYQNRQADIARMGPKVQDLSQVHSLGDLFDYAAGQAGEQLPFLASLAAGGGVGGAIGKAVAERSIARLAEEGLSKEVAGKAVADAMANPEAQAKILTAIKAGRMLGVVGAATPPQQGALYAQLKAQGVDQAAAPAWLFGALQSATLALPVEHLLGGAVNHELEASLTRGLAKEAGKQALLVGSTMAAQTALGAAARVAAGGAGFNEEDLKGVINNAALGAITGSIMGAGSELLARVGSKAKGLATLPPVRSGEPPVVGEAAAGPAPAASPQVANTASPGLALASSGDLAGLSGAVAPSEREAHVLSLLQPTLRTSPEGRATAAQLRSDPALRAKAVDAYYAGGVEAKDLAHQLTAGQVPDAQATPEALAPIPMPTPGTDPTTTFERAAAAPPEQRLDFLNRLNSNTTAPEVRTQYEAWRTQNPEEPAEEAIGKTVGVAPQVQVARALSGQAKGLSERFVMNSAVIGQGDTIDAARGVGTSKLTAKPWASSARAEAAAVKLGMSDPDADYFTAKVNPALAQKAGLAGGEGTYVFSRPKPSAELLNPVGEGPRTPTQLARHYIARARMAWDRLPPTLKDPKQAEKYGVPFFRIDAEGKTQRVMMDSREITKLGFAASPELRGSEISTPERMVRSYQNGLKMITATEVGGKRYFPADTYTDKAGTVRMKTPGGLVLADRRDGARLHYQEMRRGYSELSNSGGTVASSGPNDLNAGINPAEQVRGDTGQEGGYAQARLGEQTGVATRTTPQGVVREHGLPTRTPTAEEALANRIDQTPVAERGGPQPPPRGMETEATANRRSTADQSSDVFTTPTTSGSDIGARGAGSQSTALESTPKAAPQATSARPQINAEGRQWNVFDVKDRDVVANVKDAAQGQAIEAAVGELRGQLGLGAYQFHITDDVGAHTAALNQEGFNFAADQIKEVAESKLTSTANTVHGFVQQVGNHAYIYLHPDLSHIQRIFTLGHEIGHVFFAEHWNEQVDNETREAVVKAYQAALERGSKSGASYMDKRAARGFEEWHADQLSAYIAAKVQPRSVIQKYFGKIVEGMQKIWTTLQGHFKLSGAFEDYVNDVLLKKSFVAGDAFDHTFDALGEGGKPYVAPLANHDVLPNVLYDREDKGLWDKITDLPEHPSFTKAVDWSAEVYQHTLGKAITPMWKRIERLKIPALNDVLRHFNLRPNEAGETFYTATNNRVSAFSEQYNRAVAGLDEPAKQRLLLQLQSEKGQFDPDIAEHGARVQLLFKRMYDYQRGAHLPLQQAGAGHFFPQVSDAEQLRAPDALDTINKTLAAANIKMPDEALHDMLDALGDDAYVVNIDPTKVTDLDANFKAPFAQSLRVRTMPNDVRDALRGIKDKDGMSRFYAKDLGFVVNRYIKQSVRRAEYNRRLGDVTWDNDEPPAQGEETSRSFEPHRQLGALLDKARSQGMTHDQLRFTHDALDAFMGRYDRVSSNAVQQMNTAMMVYQQMRTLGLVAFRSIPDLANILVQQGDLVQGLKNIAKNWGTAIKGGDKDAMRLMGHAQDMASQSVMADLSDVYNEPGKRAHAISSAFFKLNGMMYWERFIRGLGYRGARDYLVRHAGNVANGLDPRGQSAQRLAELGVSVADMHHWANTREAIYGQAGVTEEDVTAKRSDFSMEQVQAAHRVTTALSRMINNVVLHNSDPTERPLWGNSGTFRLLFQLHSWLYGYASRILPLIYHNATRQGATSWERLQPLLGVSSTIPLTMLGMQLRDQLQYGGNTQQATDEKANAFWRIEQIVNRSGIMGLGSMGLDIAEAAHYGRSPITADLGPTIGQMNDFIQDPLYKSVPGAIPFLNIFPGLRGQAQQYTLRGRP